MKKLIAFALAALLATLFCVSVFAEAVDPADITGGTTGDVTIKVQVTDPSDPSVPPVDPSKVYAVNLTWESLLFTYSGAVVWNETERYYEGGTWDNANGDIIVTNNSNAAVGVSATIDTATKNGVTAVLDNATFDLASAEGGVADSETIVVSVSGNPNVAEFTLGTVTVAIEKK